MKLGDHPKFAKMVAMLQHRVLVSIQTHFETSNTFVAIKDIINDDLKEFDLGDLIDNPFKLGGPDYYTLNSKGPWYAPPGVDLNLEETSALMGNGYVEGYLKDERPLVTGWAKLFNHKRALEAQQSKLEKSE